MRVEILGAARAYDGDGRAVALGGPRVRALLLLLALDAGRVVGAERLVDGLYGADPPDGVANALQSQVSRLRRSLGRDVVEFHPAGYRLAVPPDAVDAHRFERLAVEGAQALASGDHAAAASLLRQALAEWQNDGPALVDAPFARAAASRLAELRLTATEDRIQADLALGRHRELVAELRTLTTAHPLRERLRAQLMRALYASGRQADALDVYEEARRALDDELGILPGRELSETHTAVLRADPALNAPGPPGTHDPPGASGARLGIRAQLTSFVGRAADLDQLDALLRSARLVTLIGPGGAGKTRLASEAAERSAGDVCFVPLAPITGGVARAVLDALGVREAALTATADRPAADPLVRLTGVLAGRELLLVLDNCEHLVAEAAEVADRLLAACPDLRVLATSREALGITGETLAPVAPLALPRHDATVAEALANPAVRLLADRAAAVHPGFVVDEGNAAPVVSICRALDGLPLAIELAAARLRTLTVEEVAARLDDRFKLLTRGSRTALPRHQTLRAVVAWSWDLLEEDERVLAGRLTVFADGATLEGVERVCGFDEDVLASLVDKSLVFVDGGRYRMLDTIKAFCAEHADGDLREAHAAYYLDLATTADPHLRTADQLVWLERLDGEREDLHAALRWAIDGGRAAFGLRLLSALACYWWMRGQRLVSSELAGDLLGIVGLGPVPVEGMDEEYAMCVLLAASAGAISPELSAHLEALNAPLPYDRFPYRLEFLTLMLPMFTGPPSDFDLLNDLLPEQEAGLTPWTRALSHTGGGFTWQIRGRMDKAAAAFETSIAAFRELGERWGSAVVLAGLADLVSAEGDPARALELFDEAIALADQLGAVADAAEYLSRRADCLVALGDLARAEAEYLRAAELARRTAADDAAARAHLGLGELAWRRGETARARLLVEQALAECPEDWYSAEDTRTRILLALDRLSAAGK